MDRVQIPAGGTTELSLKTNGVLAEATERAADTDAERVRLLSGSRMRSRVCGSRLPWELLWELGAERGQRPRGGE